MKRLKNEINSLVNRGVDRHLRLAVTGLSRSGKTAFITAMVNQLLNLHAGARLPETAGAGAAAPVSMPVRPAQSSRPTGSTRDAAFPT